MRTKAALILLFLAGLLIPTASFADSIQITGGSGGTATFDGGTDVFQIAGANISAFSINGGPSVAITGGVMNLTTSAASSLSLCGGSLCSAAFWTGTLTINGDGGLLLRDTFTANAPGLGLGIGTYTSSFNADLDSNPSSFISSLIDSGSITAGSLSEINLSLSLAGTNYTGDVMATVLALTAAQGNGGSIPAPEPSALVLAGLGIGSLFLLKRRFALFA